MNKTYFICGIFRACKYHFLSIGYRLKEINPELRSTCTQYLTQRKKMKPLFQDKQQGPGMKELAPGIF